MVFILGFIQIMDSNLTVNLINKPTRFPRGNQSGTPSILDHFYTNQISKIKNVGLLVDDISDNFPIVATIRLHSKKYPFHLSPYIRDFKNFSNDSFNQSVANFNDVVTDNLDTRFYNLHIHYYVCLNLHAPWRERTVKETKFSHKPWISRGLQRSISERKRLYRLSLVNHPNQNIRKHKYNRYKKTLEKALFAAKCDFFSKKIIEYQAKTKSLWGVINDITKRKKRTKTIISKLSLDDGKVTENSVEIANALNKYFVAVGPNLADKLPSSSVFFESYLRSEDSPRDSFCINPTNPQEVLNIINSFSDSNCEDPSKIAPKLYKLGAQPMSVILTNMINDCFAQGYIPSCLKIAKVIPIFKEGYMDEAGNWGPISITCCTSKLIEKLIKNRLVPYLKRNNILSKYQFGYRSHHSTTHAILNISDNIL